MDRLKNKINIDSLCELFIKHGALLGRTSNMEFSEAEKFEIVPLVFGLMPEGAIKRAKPFIQVKPLIRHHLEQVNVRYDETLVEILRAISDQYYWSTLAFEKRPKYGLRDVRSMPDMYRLLHSRQNGRCALCGCRFQESKETLDHVIPFKLVGDVLDGRNWQFLCRLCNRSKSHWLSTLQIKEAWNWVYLMQSDLEGVTGEHNARYVVLAERRKCEHVGCHNDTITKQLHVRKLHDSGFPIPDNLKVWCSDHLI